MRRHASADVISAAQGTGAHVFSILSFGCRDRREAVFLFAHQLWADIRVCPLADIAASPNSVGAIKAAIPVARSPIGRGCVGPFGSAKAEPSAAASRLILSLPFTVLAV